jgi:hypothetical protein
MRRVLLIALLWIAVQVQAQNAQPAIDSYSA